MGLKERKRWASLSPEKKERVHSARRALVGEMAPNSKLKNNDVKALRRLAESGDLTVAQIGRL